MSFIRGDAGEFSLSQRVFQERSKLRQMLGHQAGRRRGGSRTARVADLLVLGVDMGQDPFQVRIDERPRTHVLRLFLAPDHLRIAETRQLVDERLGRERIELFDAQQIDIVNTALFTLFEQIIIDLARAHDDAANLRILLQLDRAVLDDLGIVPQETVEGGLACKLGQRRRGALVAQQRLRRHQDQRLAEVALHLAAQDVEVVCRRRAVGNLHVVFGAHLQPALQTGGRVFRTLTFVAMRQKADQTGHAKPLAFTRRDELVEHDLSTVGEVAELGFPERQRIRTGQRVTIFETEDRLFRKHRVDDFVTGLRRRKVCQRDVAFLGFLIVENRVTLREGAAFAILTGKADLVALHDERTEGQCFRHRPVDAFAGLDHLRAVFHEALDRAVGVEAFRNGRQLLADFLQLLHRHAGLAATLLIGIVGGAQAGPLTVQPVCLVGLIGLARLEFLLEMSAPVGLHLLEFALVDQAFGDQAVGIDARDGLVAADDLVHLRLRERRLVAFVVAEAAVAEHVHDHRLVELHAVFGGNLGRIGHSFRIVTVDVEDRRFDHLGNVGWIGRRTGEGRVRREADLVVDDEVHGSGHAVTAQTGKTENLSNHALTRKSGIAMQKQRQNLGALGKRNDVPVPLLGQLVLLGAGLAHDHRVDDFKVRRVGRQRQVNLVAVEFAVGGGAEVILHVARTFDIVRLERAALELVEHGAVRLAHDVRQNIQAAAVSHAENDFLEPFLAAALDNLLERRDERFTAIETETLGALEANVEELFVTFGFDQLRQDCLLAFGCKGNALIRAFDTFLNPGLFFRAGHMHEFDADGGAVGALQNIDHLAHGRIFEAEHVIDKDLAVVIAFLEAVGLRRELVVILDGNGNAERVELGMQVAAHAVGADHHDGANAVTGRLQHFGFADGLAGVGALGLSLCLNLLFDGLFDRGPIAVQCGNQVAICRDRPVGTLPGGALGRLLHIFRIIGQCLEEALPLRRHGRGILFVPGIELLDIGCIRAVQKRRDLKLLVRFLPCHCVLADFSVRLLDAVRAVRPACRFDYCCLPPGRYAVCLSFLRHRAARA
ncbi:hypothetical protein AT6N2_C2847 [Agrobacterium tumefaciens]|nr:hypothetical protein AT6N2_C2847 [Agrobacterium tumefaciens]